jgi:non-homologous end joining protein Ku
MQQYILLRKLLEKTGMAAIGKVTMSTKERVGKGAI